MGEEMRAPIRNINCGLACNWPKCTQPNAIRSKECDFDKSFQKNMSYPHLPEAAPKEIKEITKHSHYFKPCPYSEIDVYRVIEIFKVTCPVMQHVVKKALCSGNRGHKDLEQDIRDIRDSAARKLQMLDEDKVLCSELK